MTEYTFEDLMYDLLNEEDKCRICLKKGSLQSIRSDYYSNFKIYDMLRKLNCVLDSNTTTKICTKCLERLKTAYEFTLSFDEATKYYENLNPYFNVNEKKCNENIFFSEAMTPEDNNLYISVEQNIANESTTVDKNKLSFSNDCNSVQETTLDNYLYFSKQNSATEATTSDKNKSYFESDCNSENEPITPELYTYLGISKRNTANESTVDKNKPKFSNDHNSVQETTLENYLDFSKQNTTNESSIVDENKPSFSSDCNSVKETTLENNYPCFSKQNSANETTAIDKNDCNFVYKPMSPELFSYLDFSKQNTANESAIVDENKPSLAVKETTLETNYPSFSKQNSANETTIDKNDCNFVYKPMSPELFSYLEFGKQNTANESSIVDENKPSFSSDCNSVNETTLENNYPCFIEQNTAKETTTIDKNDCNFFYKPMSPELYSYLDFSKQNTANESSVVDENKPSFSSDCNSVQEITLENNYPCFSKQNTANETTTIDKNDCNFFYKPMSPELYSYLDFSKENTANESSVVDENKPSFSSDYNSVQETTIDKNDCNFVYNPTSPELYSYLDFTDFSKQNTAYEATTIDKNDCNFVYEPISPEFTYLDISKNTVNTSTNVDENKSYFEQNSTYEQTAIDKSNSSFNYKQKTNETDLDFNMEEFFVFDVTNVDNNNTSFNKEENPIHGGSTVDKNYFRDCFVRLEKMSQKYENIKNKTKVKTSSKKIEKIRSKRIAKIKKECPPLEENIRKTNKTKVKTSSKNFKNISKQTAKIKKEGPPLKENIRKANKLKVKTSIKQAEKKSKKKQLDKECPPSGENLKKGMNIPIQQERKMHNMLEKILKANNPFLSRVEFINTQFSKQPRNKRNVKNKTGRPASEANLKKNRVLVVSTTAIREVFQKQISPAVLKNKDKNFSIKTTVLLCNTCDKLFLSESVLEAHHCFGEGKVLLSLRKKEIKCSRCDRKFKNVQLLSNHVCFLLKCLKCKILFKSNKDLEEHENENCS